MRRQKYMLAICVVLLGAAPAFAQNKIVSPDGAIFADKRPTLSRSSDNPDQTLEIMPRVAPGTPAATPAPSMPDDAAPVPTSGVPAAETNSRAPADANRKRPYLGISVQYISSRATPGREVHGLEVVDVDSNSPAASAGLRGRGAMTKLGASGATAGALMPPFDLVVMPLLKKSGQLGESGDLIVAIDDRRVESEGDLETELDALKPGDTIYFTVVRPARDGSRDTIKIPVSLGAAARASDANVAGDNAAPVTPRGVSALAPGQ